MVSSPTKNMFASALRNRRLYSHAASPKFLAAGVGEISVDGNCWRKNATSVVAAMKSTGFRKRHAFTNRHWLGLPSRLRMAFGGCRSCATSPLHLEKNNSKSNSPMGGFENGFVREKLHAAVGWL